MHEDMNVRLTEVDIFDPFNSDFTTEISLAIDKKLLTFKSDFEIKKII